MRLSKILLPTDFSAHSYEGLRTAGKLAHQAGAELLIVHVVHPSDEHATEALNRNLEERLVETTMPACANLTVSHTLLEGDVAEEIIRFAKQQQVDLIVMGSHGRTGIPRVLMGSVATQIVRHAPCAILTVRPKVQLRGDIKAWAHRRPEPRETPTPQPTSNQKGADS